MYIHISIVGKTNSGNKEPSLGTSQEGKKKKEREREKESHWRREREKGREKQRSRIYLLVAHSVREWHRRMCAAPQTIKNYRNGEQPPMDPGALDRSAMAPAKHG